MKRQPAKRSTEAINNFFSDFDKEAAQARLWEMYYGWAMSERARNCEPGLPADVLFFYVQVSKLIKDL